MDRDEVGVPLLHDAAGSNSPLIQHPADDDDDVFTFRPIHQAKPPPGSSLSPVYRQKTPKFRQILATVICAFAPLSFGLVLGYSSPTISGLTKDGILDKSRETWFASVPTLGALVGALVGGFSINKIGRKGTLIACGLPFVIGWGMIIFVKLTSSYPLLLAGRAVCGASMGVVCTAAPTYIGEIASPDMRGALGTVFQVATCLGIFMAFIVGIPLSWQWLAVVCLATNVLMTILMVFVPETPRYLAAKGLDAQARNSLKWLRGNSYDIEEEYEEITAQIDANPDTSITISDLKKKSIYKPVLLSMGLMFFQQSSGINDIVFYAESIFNNVPQTMPNSTKSTTAAVFANPAIPGVIITAVQVVATASSLFVIDRLGRRILLSISGSLMCVGCITMGVNYYIQEHNHQAGYSWLPIASLILFVTAFSLGFGPVPWTLMAELVPSRVKGVASGIAVVTNWLTAFIITKEFVDLERGIHQYGTFWLFAGINALGVIYVFLLLPETKGKSLEEIEQFFSSI